MKDKMKAAKKRMTDFFESKGIAAQDIGKAIAVHEAMGLGMLAVTWSSCYLFPPSQSKLMARPIASMKAMLPNKMLSGIGNNAVFQSKYGSSYIEASCCRKIIRPFTIPGKLWATYYVVRMGKSDKAVDGEGMPIKSRSKDSKSSRIASIQREPLRCEGNICRISDDNEASREVQRALLAAELDPSSVNSRVSSLMERESSQAHHHTFFTYLKHNPFCM